ncbi:MAG: 16S rRNA (guanine(966)-N(2))-methyltransferase RsmD [Candidatus Latescibacteria bacterium]|nr:16S rRNA (guanine(966)-N(2))-methyltransferase RsmD [bacterium]MBD3425465.1 16S rRNA (guanine(966)-N(2))-methyltransferase RsmD [Candidatus Latescibacterota bacterium]
MRVIGGRYHGRKLKGIRGDQFRPTTQMVKGAILDSLYGDVQDGSFLDLFAGSGGVGIEALSRGAGKAVFVEKSRRAADIIEENLGKCGIDPGSYAVIRNDAIDFLRREAEEGKKYRVIFADPPYSTDMAMQVMDFICNLDYRICRILIIECAQELSPPPECCANLKRIKSYGQTYVNYFRF